MTVPNVPHRATRSGCSRLYCEDIFLYHTAEKRRPEICHIFESAAELKLPLKGVVI